MRNFLLLLSVGLVITCLPLNIWGDDNQASFDKMRSSFDESFENKVIVNAVVVEQPQETAPIAVVTETISNSVTVAGSTTTPLNDPANSQFNYTFNFGPWPILIFLLSIWVLYDANNLRVKKGLATGFPDCGPVGWFFLTLCCCCIGFPLYLEKRGRYIKANATKSLT